ncbi:MULTISPECIES: LPS-assembly lipoprotein LptE [Marinobacter]|uniref:LPS-assembly lipoprotein LptE n=1 Tax=Marinobacter profundi TaxID=2666256 RepID=A0A2G1UIN8_9GAMM|nr:MULTISPECIES: LPS assembly lipoprotein LptE [Marinobacter]MBD3655266.1 hypothetical protein [Marinobacter sp.]PHQ14366.1 hypothetical protein CLH61_13685 [Marinobacter profundi]
MTRPLPTTRTLLGLLTLAGLAVVAGCGFQLRGSAPVPAALQPLAVTCDSQVPELLCNDVREQLIGGDVVVVEPEQADYVLRLREFREQRRASAITLQASAAEYTIRQTLRMDVLTSDQVPLIADTELSSIETYRYDEANVLAKQREEEALRESLYQQLAQQVIFRLAPLNATRIEAIRAASRESTGEADSRR